MRPQMLLMSIYCRAVCERAGIRMHLNRNADGGNQGRSFPFDVCDFILTGDQDE